MRRWSPTAILIAGWVVFVLGCYPGYLSFDSAAQLGEVRSRVYTDVHPPLMTGLWGLCEYVFAGPFPMLLIQSGLLLFGLAGVLRHVLSPRAAAVTAAAVLVFPPVFAPMAVIWPDSLMTGALLAGFAALATRRRPWQLTGCALLVLAASCHPEILLALVPLAVWLAPPDPRWKRVVVATAIAVGITGVARVADRVIEDDHTFAWHQRLILVDEIGTLRRAKVTDPATLERILRGLPVAAPAQLAARIAAGSDALDAWPLAHGDKRVLDPLRDEREARLLSAIWGRTIVAYPRAYARHRWTLVRGLLGLAGPFAPVYDELGDLAQLAPLHHRALPSDWERGMRAVVRAVAGTPLFRPWLYLALALAGLGLAWRRPVLRALLASGLVYEAVLLVAAPATDYRYSHWLVTVTTAVLAALAVSRREAWRAAVPPRAA